MYNNTLHIPNKQKEVEIDFVWSGFRPALKIDFRFWIYKMGRTLIYFCSFLLLMPDVCIQSVCARVGYKTLMSTKPAHFLFKIW